MIDKTESYYHQNLYLTCISFMSFPEHVQNTSSDFDQSSKTRTLLP